MTEKSGERLSIAVIGAGAAGLVVARLLQEIYEVTVFECGPVAGGHAVTYHVPSGEDEGIALDLGFMVFNFQNYPRFVELLTHLGITDYGNADMSFSLSTEQSEETIYFPDSSRRPGSYFTEQGTRDPATPSREVLRVIPEILRFGRQLQQDLDQGLLQDESLGDYLRRNRYSDNFIRMYLIPSTAAVWSSAPKNVLQGFPIDSYARFMSNHGMLGRDRVPQWKFVRGGSRRYVDQITSSLRDRLQLNRRVISIRRENGKVTVEHNAGTQVFERVILAAPANVSCRLLGEDSTPAEREMLGVWNYQRNRAVLHTDTNVLPSDPEQWASWNVSSRTVAHHTEPQLRIHYFLNRLQGHSTARANYILSLNPPSIREDRILLETEFSHPLYTRESYQSQRLIRSLQGKNETYFCGAYCGNGFHEDAVVSAITVAEHLGVTFAGFSGASHTEPLHA